MKKLILTTAITTLSLGITSLTTQAKAEEKTTQIATPQAISQIEVRGNVQVYLSNDVADKVTTYSNYYASNALVQEEGGVLRISSYNAEPLTVWVKVANLHKVLAFDNAKINSFGRLASIDLQVNLFNKATAQLDVDAFNLNCRVHDYAIATLTGSAENSDLHYGQFAAVNTNGYDTANLVKVKHEERFRFHGNKPGNELKALEMAAARSV